MKNFKSKIHIACGSDKHRPVFGYVFFNKGRAIATDAMMLAVQCLKTVHELDDSDISKLEGKFIHKSIFKSILETDYIEIKETGITCFKHNNKSFFEYDEIPDRQLDIDRVLNFKPFEINGIVLNAKLIKRASEILFSKGESPDLCLDFSGENRIIKVYRHNDDNQDKNFVGIMPIMRTK